MDDPSAFCTSMTAFAPGLPEGAGMTGMPHRSAEDGNGGSRDVLSEYFAVEGRRVAGRRYGRFVGIAKLLLLILAGGLVALVAIWPQLHKEGGLIPIGSMRIEQEDVESLRVVNARFTGSSSEGRPYTVTFDNATQTRQESDLVILSGPKADIVLHDGSWIAVEAPGGRFHKGNRVLELDQTVNLFHDSGMELRTGSVTFNLERGTGAGYDPLHAQGPLGRIDSQGLRIRESLGVFQFVGPVQAVISAAPGVAR